MDSMRQGTQSIRISGPAVLQPGVIPVFRPNCLEHTSMSADSSSEQPSTVFVRFLLDADASPGLLSRLLQPYAKRDLIPDRMWSHPAGKTIHVRTEERRGGD